MKPIHLGRQFGATTEPSTLRIAPGRDPALLRDFLAAHFARQRACALRELLVHLLAVLSGLVWVAAVRPRWLGTAATDSVLGAWVVFALATLGAALTEVHWRQQCLRLRQQVDAAPPGP